MPVILVGRKPTIYIHGSDLTSNGRASSPDLAYESVDVTTFDDSARRFNPGLQTVTYQYDGLYDGSAGKSWLTLTGMQKTARVVSVYVEGDGSGSVGIGLGSARAETVTPAGAPGEAEMFGASIVQSGTYDTLRSLVSSTAVTADFTGGTYDRGASSTNGGALYVHIFTNVQGDGNQQWIVRLQHATTATGAYADAATATVGSGTTIGTVITFTGTFRQFARIVADLDGTTGTLEFQGGFAVR